MLGIPLVEKEWILRRVLVDHLFRNLVDQFKLFNYNEKKKSVNDSAWQQWSLYSTPPQPPPMNPLFHLEMRATIIDEQSNELRESPFYSFTSEIFNELYASEMSSMQQYEKYNVNQCEKLKEKL